MTTRASIRMTWNACRDDLVGDVPELATKRASIGFVAGYMVMARL